MIDISCFYQGICHPQRIDWLKENITHLDKQNFPFKKKFLMIDEFNGHTFPLDYKLELESNGWDVRVYQFKSRSRVMDELLKLVDTEYIFYNEDDVAVNMPNIDDLDKVFNMDVDGKKVGLVSLNLGGTNMNLSQRFIGDLANIEKNTLLKNDKYTMFFRDEAGRSNYFIDFPGLFIRKSVLRNCLDGTVKRAQIEAGLTAAYFKLGMENTFKKVSICLNTGIDIINNTPEIITKEWHNCRLLDNLDPNQGSSPHGGSHNI
jgi:hypothetical protein